jgi:hypothetical protein
MRTKLLGRVLLASILMLGTACKKNVPGPAGEPGKNGANGNANLSSSTVITLLSNRWESRERDNETYWYTKLYIPEITSLVLRNGDIKVYAMSGGDWFALPFYEGLLVTQATFSEGLVELEHSNLHGGTTLRPAERSYRVLVLSPK